MQASAAPPAPIEPELLVASFTTQGHVAHRNEAWGDLFGTSENAWYRLDGEAAEHARRYVLDASHGTLVTNQLFQVQVPGADQPVAVLLHFIPVCLPTSEGELTPQGVTVSGEVLAEPTSWTESQTHRHRMETLGRMSMGIAHDFNNLLSGILGYTELMKTQLRESGTDGAFLENLDTVEKAALDGANLIRRIQHYIRQEHKTHFEPLSLNDLVQDCISLTRPYWYNEPRRRGISIEVHCSLDDVPPIRGSATELREVLINLMLNAVQAMPGGGRISLMTWYQPQEGVYVALEDTGVGMDLGVQDHIFEPLFTTKGDKGSGMGLAVSYGIVQEHDGLIEVSSAPGEGARFQICLPPAGSEAAEAEPPEDPGQVRPIRILVVDDEPMVRSILTKLLRVRGHATHEAHSGPTGLGLLEQERFDVVFTDHGMPEMSGTDFARSCRSRWPDLPIVLITGDTDVSGASELVDAVVAKPFTLDQLDRVIRQLDL